MACVRQRDVNRPRAVGPQLRVDVLEMLHVLTDHEQVVLLLVHRLELAHEVAGARAADAHVPGRRFARPHGCWRRRRPAAADGPCRQFEPVVTHVERRRANERHAAFRTRAGDVERVVRMHRADERRRLDVAGRRAELRGDNGSHDQKRRDSCLDRMNCRQMSHVFPGQDSSPREAGQRETVASEAERLRSCSRSGAEPRYRCGLVALPS